MNREDKCQCQTHINQCQVLGDMVHVGVTKHKKTNSWVCFSERNPAWQQHECKASLNKNGVIFCEKCIYFIIKTADHYPLKTKAWAGRISSWNGCHHFHVWTSIFQSETHSQMVYRDDVERNIIDLWYLPSAVAFSVSVQPRSRTNVPLKAAERTSGTATSHPLTSHHNGRECHSFVCDIFSALHLHTSLSLRMMGFSACVSQVCAFPPSGDKQHCSLRICFVKDGRNRQLAVKGCLWLSVWEDFGEHHALLWHELQRV